MAGFSYAQLESSLDQIRLLRIPPRDQETNTIASSFLLPLNWVKNYILFSKSPPQISCTTETTSLSKDLIYLTLSYAVGDPTPSKQILIEGKKISITKDLNTALQHVQQENKATIIWVESLCTKQIDAGDEKAEPAMKIQEIYQQAHLVLVWLGLASDGSDELLDLLVRIGRACDNVELPFVTTQSLFTVSETPDEPCGQDVTFELEQLHAQFDYMFPHFFPFEAYRAFLRRGWWHRHSPVRELAGTGYATFWCGEKSISYKHLNSAHTFLRSYCCSNLGRDKFPDSPFDQEDTVAFEDVMNVGIGGSGRR